MSQSTLFTLEQWLDTHQNLIIQYQTALTAIPALSPVSGGQGELKKAQKLKALLETMPIKTEQINAPDPRVESGIRPNLIALLPGLSNDKTIWIMAHTDVVPPGDLNEWNTDPFEAVVKGDKIYGRGTEDNQQGIVSALLAVQAFVENDIIPPFRIGLAFVADEENGSEYGIDYLLKHHNHLFSTEDMIIIPDVGNPRGDMIEIAEKSILWIKCNVTGRQTHGSTPEQGINARKAAARFTVKMDRLYQQFDISDPSFEPPVSTFEPTRIEANIDNINTIPGRDVCYFDCRILPCYALDEIKQAVKSIAEEVSAETGATFQLAFPQDVQAPDPTPADTPASKALQQAVRHVLKREARPIGIGGGTVAASFRKHGLPAVGWCTLDETLHGPNEYASIQNTLNDARVFAHVFLNPGIE